MRQNSRSTGNELPGPLCPYRWVTGMMTSISLQILPWVEIVLGICTSAISARISGNAKERKDILDPLNRRYNHGKHRALNYSVWSAQGQGQQIRTN